ncbi:phosphoenolpyruvate--protein phosphotransferase [candidate division KSB1 bacterium]|nr:phosphoenolpyruvate--protein phosphotransferase [candidate division KSB1 bacterium]
MPKHDVNKKEIRMRGVPVSAGVAIGKAFVLGCNLLKVESCALQEQEVEREITRLHAAIEKAKQELALLRDQTEELLGERDAAIFEIHQLMLEDTELVGEVVRRIRSEKKNADRVYLDVVTEYEQSLTKSKSELFRSRVTDLHDIARRVIRHIQGDTDKKSDHLPGPSVVIGTDLTPSDTINLKQTDVLGFATELGSRTSHAAIMARSLKVPSIVGLGDLCRLISTGDQVILDGNAGTIIIHPDEATVADYRKLLKAYRAYVQKLEKCKKYPARTRDGKNIELAANVEFSEEVKPALQDGANGIGLYRTEYLYLTRLELPSEAEQFTEYKRIVRSVGGQHPVIIRTFDLGGDKAQKHFHIHQEANPFLGFRGVRLYSGNESIFTTQLRAILRTSVYGKLRILLPMIASVSEIRYCKEMIEKTRVQLSDEGVELADEIPVGAMIEVPSAAISADLIAQECDFLSIGTNDLIQYTLAVDRGNKYVANLYRAYNPAVLRLIRDSIRQGHEQGVWVGMCGEMASDPLATMVLVGMGLDELSVSPVSLLVIKEIIRRIEYAECENLADRVLGYATADEVEKYLLSVFKNKFKDLIFSELHNQYNI